ncbi:tyrosine-type recombinase/integrase [Nocardia sp. CA2R105]|uniref:tyrosine-type recombinase/integrase n=1 Tax=Nocardia coffeae TaxID=2873381 RepID=UPI001CA786DF|nr:tyrosine-type recombinase/integrase [Nocardia coffeae]MBY8856619.1 tyrosine-type recombinase/integrase [Nocardia coffeae]
MPTPRPRPRSDGTVAWQVPFSIYEYGRRRQTSETFDTLDDASRWADLLDRIGVEQALKVLDAQQNDLQREVVTVTAWLRRYADLRTGIQSDSRRKYHRYIDNDIDPFMGYLPIEAVTQETDASFVVHLEEDKGNAPKTIHNKHGFLSAGMRAAAELRPTPLIAFNPCATTRLPRVDTPEIEIFDDTEWELFEQLMPPRWRPQAEFGLVSMARPGEISALLVGDVNRKTGAVRINKAWKDQGSRMVLGKPKTKRGVRTVNIPLESLDRLDLDRPRDELLFHTTQDTPIRSVYFYEKAWLPALRRLQALHDLNFRPFTRAAGWTGADPEMLLDQFEDTVPTLIAKRLTPYTLRHTGISWRLQDGIPLFVVSRDAGHESTSTTDRIYGHNNRRASESAALVVASRLPRVRRALLQIAA